MRLQQTIVLFYLAYILISKNLQKEGISQEEQEEEQRKLNRCKQKLEPFLLNYFHFLFDCQIKYQNRLCSLLCLCCGRIDVPID